MKKIFTLLFVMIATINGYSQFSKTHYIPPLTSANSTKPNSGAASSTDPSIIQYIYISTPSTTNVTVTITPIGSAPVVNTAVNNLNPWVYQITTPNTTINGATFDTKPPFGVKKTAQDGFDNQLFVDYSKTGMVLKDKGFLIEASDLVYANVRVTSSTGDDPLKPSNPSQAGGLVAKGLSAYGTDFRIGGFENKAELDSGNYGSQLTFASFIATEDNTTVRIELPRGVVGTTTFHNGVKYNGPFTVTLNKNDSYTFAIPNTGTNSFDSNLMIGGRITSDRNIVVNSGSIGGNSQTTPTIASGISLNKAGKDYGFDQIVGADKIGKEYVFIGGAGMNQSAKAYDLERVIIVANVNGTQVFKNGPPVAIPANGSTPAIPAGTLVTTLQAGQYYVFNGNDYVGSAATGYNLYVTTSENVFVYQCIAGKNDAGNQNMFFVPPLNCATPSVVNNIPHIQQVGQITYTNAVINITTEASVADPTPVVTSTNLGAVPLTGTNSLRSPVTGKPGFFTYTYPKPGGAYPTGHVSISAPKQIYVSYYGSNSNATYGSYFSGFDIKPIIAPVSGDPTSICINTGTSLTTGAGQVQWQFSPTKNGTYVDIPGATQPSYTPTNTAPGMGPGYYSVTKISACTSTSSDPVAVSACPEDTDGDGVYNNIDIDSDNDGITNTNESYGDKGIDVSSSTGTLTAGTGSLTYSNSYTTTTTPTGAGNTFTGSANGNFTTSLAAGITNKITYGLNFSSKPISLALQYNPAGATAISQSNAAFEIQTGLNTTITISNPTNQLLIDTNNDGIYESGVTEFSSFDIKFKLNPAVLSPSAGTPPAIDFKIQTYMATSISFTHENTSGTQANSASFSFIALSVPKDSDGDGKADQVDTDSDEDGILDIEEGQSGTKSVTPFIDNNKNGLADIFETPVIVAPTDTDIDGVPDYLDLDSDNDGILDSVESGTIALAATTPKVDADGDGIKNYRELDSDNDTCYDINETAVAVASPDGILGTAVDPNNGKVNGGTYTTPTAININNYLTAKAKPVISATNLSSDCGLRRATITVSSDDPGPGITYKYKWQVSTNGGAIFTDITNSNGGGTTVYSNFTTDVLTIQDYQDQYQYRAEVSNVESACLTEVSQIITIVDSNAPRATNVIYPLCDVDGLPTENPMDGVTKFDLTTKIIDIDTTPATIPPSAANTVTFHTTQQGANSNTAVITDPANFINTTPFTMDVYARVQNSAGCFAVSTVTLRVGIKLPNSYVAPNPTPICDDASGNGLATFDLTGSKTAFEALFPTTGYTVTFYPSPLDASNQTSAIPNANLGAYTNTSNGQEIGVRVNNNNTTDFNGCFSLKKFTLNVEALPTATAVGPFEHCDDDGTKDGIYNFSFSPLGLEAQILNGQSSAKVTFYDETGALLPTITNSFVTKSQIIKAVVSNTNGQLCEAAPIFIDFKVNPLPVVNDGVHIMCDNDLNGIATFDLTLNNSKISTNFANENFTYYTSRADAIAGGTTGLITSPYTNTTSPFLMDVWARVVNNTTSCFNVSQITLKVVAAFDPAYIVPLDPICDNGTNKRDGIATFNISATKATLENQLPLGYTVSYFKNKIDADSNINAITDLTNVQNTTNPQQIWIRVNNNIPNSNCFSTGPHITLNVQALPIAKATKELYKECDNDTDGQFSFINTVDSEVRKGRTDVTVEYYNDATGALLFPSNTQFPSPYNTANLTVRAKVINNTPQLCEDETIIVFQVDVKPVVVDPATPIAFTDCDNEADPMQQDGKVSFSTSSIESTILAAQTDPQVMIISYFDAANSPLKDANGVLIGSPFPSTFISGTQTINYKVENKNNLNNTGCTAQGTIQFTVNPLPKINVNSNGDDNEVICSDSSIFVVNLDASIEDGSPITNYTYQWSKDGVDLVGETGYTLSNVTVGGLYRVEVTNATNCSRVRTIKVSESEKAVFDENFPFTVTDLTENNTITVNLKPGLKGNYEYSLDDEVGGYYQDSNVFTNVSPGTHFVYVRDKNGCGTEPDSVAVIGVPKFFTPNGDGYNDTWNIGGIDTDTRYTIFIYDRYGKLLKELIPQSTQGWDGIFNGNLLPGSDYWYSLKLENGREAKGHFSLKR